MNFNIKNYLVSLNNKSSIKLDTLLIEDLAVEIGYYLQNKNYNTYLIQKTCLKFFLNEINKKKRLENVSSLYSESSNEEEVIKSRLEKLNQLKINQKQRAIIKDLILGLTYEEIRKKYELSSKQLRNLIYYFKNTLKYKTK
ncbi:MAG: hypothetical protein AB1304_02875 [Bacteroidota bacterium]